MVCRFLMPLLLFSMLACFAWAGAPVSVEDWKPRHVSFSTDEMMLDRALAELQNQTGNVVEDRRGSAANRKVKLPAKRGEFWKALDLIGKETGIGFSAYQADGGVALVDAPYRALPTHYSGIFRFTTKRIAVSRDDETQTHTCQVTLDTAWEPRFQMLYLSLDQATVDFGNGNEKLERQTARSVAGTSAAELDLRMKAPARQIAKLRSLNGTIRMIGAPKMLEFAFAKLHTKPIKQEGVNVSLTAVKKQSNRWSVEVLSEYPEGALVSLESYQSWMDNNRVWLSWGNDPKTKKPYELEPSGQSPQDSKAGTKIRYEFTPRPDTPLPSAGIEVTLRTRLPNRVVAFTVPFAFQDLILP